MARLPRAEDRPLLTVDEVIALGVLRRGRSAIYEAIRRGEVPSVRIGRTVYVPTGKLRALLGLEADEDG